MSKEKDEWINLLSPEQRFELAKISIQTSMPLIDSFATSSIKTIMMLNGGAAVAMLAFLGAIVSTEFNKWILGLVWALGVYSLGAVCAAFVSFFSYISQSYYNQVETIEKGDFYRYLAIGIAFGGAICFIMANIIVGV